MGTALLKIKIMPESPDADLEAIENKSKEIVKEKGGKNPSTVREPIAFGLNAVIINFSMDESLSVDEFEDSLKEIEQVNSTEVVDFRRAFG